MQGLADALRFSSAIDVTELDAALDIFGESEDLWRNLVSRELITEEEVFQAIAESVGLQYVSLDNVEIEAQTLSYISSDFCRRHKVLPLRTKGDHLFLAVADPHNIIVMDDAEAMVSFTVAPVVVSPSALDLAIERFLRSDEELLGLAEQIGEEYTSENQAEEIEASDDDAPIVRFVNLLISQAIQDRASDIHVEPTAKDLRVRFRIDGVLHEVQKAEKSTQAGILSRLKIMADIDIAEKRKPQDGRMSVSHQGAQIDIRVASLPTVWGEKIIMRILDHDNTKRSLDSVGMSESNLRILREAISRPSGMVIVTGPTGSGKSTTLYTSLDEVSTPSVNVITVEDPVEKRIEGVNQVQINAKAGLTFPAALKSILRADPDVILIGEVRDTETAAISVEASLTGHLVLTTLHTNGAPDAIPRLIEMGVEPYLVSTAVSCVVAQRLARKLCNDCKKPAESLDAEVLERLGFPKVDGEYPEIFEHVGCTKCAETGYRGRVGLLEIMAVTEDIARLAVERVAASVIRASADKTGLVSLREDGWRRVILGETTIEEVLRVCA